MFSVEEEGSSEGLSELGFDGGWEEFFDFGALVGAFGGEADFDELVLGEGVVDGGDDSVGEAVFSELDEGVEVVTEGAEVSALFSGEAHGGVGGRSCLGIGSQGSMGEKFVRRGTIWTGVWGEWGI